MLGEIKNKKRDDLKILLIQMRSDVLKKHEADCILKYGKLQPEQLIAYDAVKDPVNNELVDGMDAVIVGGAKEYRVSQKDLPSLPLLEQLVRYSANKDIPVLGICYGAHVIAEAFGGEIVYSPETKELTTVDVHCLSQAPGDELFFDMPHTFKANCGHVDDIGTLPAELVPLARSDKCRFHAFKLAGRPVYAMQFHIELGKKEDWERMDFAFKYGGYFKDKEDLQKAKDQVQDTPESTALVEKFIDRIVLPVKQWQKEPLLVE